MFNFPSFGPRYPDPSRCESIQAITHRCFTDRWMCIDAFAGVSMSKARHDFRLPSQNNRLSNACEIYKSETMGGLMNDYSSALYEGMQNLPLNKKSYSSSLLAILEKPAPSCRSEGNQMMLY